MEQEPETEQDLETKQKLETGWEVEPRLKPDAARV